MNTFFNYINTVFSSKYLVSATGSFPSFTEITFILFLSFMLLLGLLIIFSKDVIYCLLGLISLYVMGALLVLSYDLQFLSFSLVVVSLGAVAVLFLYVVLMVNLKGSRMQESMYYKFNISSFAATLTFTAGFLFFKKDEIDTIYFVESYNSSLRKSSDLLSDYLSIPFYTDVTELALEVNDSLLKVYGLVIYDKYFILFVLIGVLLLAALIGCLLISYEIDAASGSDPVKLKARLAKVDYSVKVQN